MYALYFVLHFIHVFVVRLPCFGGNYSLLLVVVGGGKCRGDVRMSECGGWVCDFSA